MRIDGRGEMTAKANRERPDGGFLDQLRAAALIAVPAGAVGSVGLLLHASQRTPRFLLVLFVIWVLAPFMALWLANVVATRWSALTRATLHSMMLVVTLGSLAIYTNDALHPPRAKPAFVFVAVPLGSWLLVAVAILIAALLSGRRSRRGGA